MFEAEGIVLKTLLTRPQAALHPFTLLPLAGQMLLVITVFQKQPSPWLTISGIVLLAVLLVFMLAIGLMAAKYWLAISTLLVMACAVMAWRTARHKAT